MSSIPPIRTCKAAILEALRELGGQGTRAEIVDLAERLGRFSDAERRTPPPPTKSQYHSYLAYCLSWAITALRRDGAIERVGRAVWRLT